MDLSSLSTYLTTLSGGHESLLTKLAESSRVHRGLSLVEAVKTSVKSSGDYQHLGSVDRVIIDDFIEAKSDILLSLQTALVNGDEALIEVLQSDLRDLASIEADLDLLQTLELQKQFRENLKDLIYKSAKATVIIAGLV